MLKGETMRNYGDSIVDKVLLMKLIQNAQKKGRLSIIPLHKLAFISEYTMNSNHLKGFNYTFYRDRFGPAAPGVYDDFTALVDSELIEDSPFSITPKGRKFIDGLAPAFERTNNSKIVGIIDDTVRRNPIKTPAIKAVVYDMDLILPDGSHKKIPEIPYLTKPQRKILLLEKLPRVKVKQEFTLTEDEIETFEIVMDTELCQSIERGEQDIKNGRCCN